MSLAYTTIAAAIATTGVAGHTWAQEAPAQQEEIPLFSLSDFGFTESINFYNYGNIPNTTEFVQNVHWSVAKDITLDLSLPFYTNGNTGLGMASVGLSAPVIQKPFSFVNTVTVGFDLKLPTSTNDFGGDDVNPVVSLETNGSTPVEKFNWEAGFSYEWNGDGSFAPVLGGLVYDDIMHVSGALSRELCSDMLIKANFNHWDGFDFGHVTTLGPSIAWTPCSNAEINFSVDFPISDSDNSDLDSIFGVGVSLKF